MAPSALLAMMLEETQSWIRECTSGVHGLLTVSSFMYAIMRGGEGSMFPLCGDWEDKERMSRVRSLLRGRRAVIAGVIALIVLVVAGGGWYYYTQHLQEEPVTVEETVQTATIRRGSLVVMGSGTGTLVPRSEVELSFSSGGLVTELLVEVGDQVEVDDPLVRVDDADAQAQVAEAEINLRLAELDLAALTETPDAAELEAAQMELTSAQEALKDLLNGPSHEDRIIALADLSTAELELQQAQSAYDAISWRPDVGSSSEAMELWAATAAYDKAKATYDQAVAGPTEEEIASARANVASAQSNLNSLLNGTTAEELETAQLNVEQARSNLAAAQVELEDTILVAPVAGTVTSVDAAVGEVAGTSAIVTLADLSDPLVEIYMDETDLDLIAVGYQVEVIFDALPEQTFTGEVVRVDPALVDMEGAPTIQALAKLDSDDGSDVLASGLLSGLNGTVDVIAGSAENALLAPSEALWEISPGEYAVFVMVDGELEVRPVEVGLMDYAYAEILSGLEQGDLVSTGVLATE
jgi:HlyD family secretion protein